VLRRLAILALGLALALGPAHAGAGASGFALDRYQPAERGGDFYLLDSASIRGHLVTAGGATLDWGHRPLVVLSGADGRVTKELVGEQLFTHLGASVTFRERFRAGVSIPFAPWVSGEDATLGSESYRGPSGVALGDIRLGGDALVLGKPGDPWHLSAGLRLFLPTGSEEKFAGDGGLRAEPRAVAAGDRGIVGWAVELGYAYRFQKQVFAGAPIGDQLCLAAAGGVRLYQNRLFVGPELGMSALVWDGSRFLAGRFTPFELLVGARYRVTRDWRVGGAIGPGLSRGLGTPQIRVLAGVEWSPPTGGETP
jgi:hypothetical protein